MSRTFVLLLFVIAAVVTTRALLVCQDVEGAMAVIEAMRTEDLSLKIAYKGMPATVFRSLIQTRLALFQPTAVDLRQYYWPLKWRQQVPAGSQLIIDATYEDALNCSAMANDLLEGRAVPSAELMSISQGLFVHRMLVAADGPCRVEPNTASLYDEATTDSVATTTCAPGHVCGASTTTDIFVYGFVGLTAATLVVVMAVSIYLAVRPSPRLV